jgi:hypothetical protein
VRVAGDAADKLEYVLKLRDITTLPARLAEGEFNPETGQPRRVKLHDKNAANFAMHRHFCNQQDSETESERGGDVNVLNVFGNLSPDDHRVFIAALRNLAAARRAGQLGEGVGAPARAAGAGVRTMTTNGHVLLTFTPLEGMSEVVLEFLEGAALPPRDEELVGNVLKAVGYGS